MHYVMIAGGGCMHLLGMSLPACEVDSSDSEQPKFVSRDDVSTFWYIFSRVSARGIPSHFKG